MKQASLGSLEAQMTGKRRSMRLRRYLVSYSMIAPFYVLFAVFGVFPMLYSFWLSFYSWDGLGPQVFRGLGNYGALFSDPLFWTALSNTVSIGVIASLIVGVLSLSVAVMLDSWIGRFNNLFRALFFLPVLISTIAAGIIFNEIFGQQFGFLNDILQWLGLQPIPWLTSGAWLKPSIILVEVWRWTGWNVVLFTAGLLAIPRELYEAAMIDGANRLRVFWHITLPLLRPVTIFVVIMMINGSLQLFEEPLMLTSSSGMGLGGPDNAGLTLALYLAANAVDFNRLGYASALGYMIGVLVFAVTGLFLWRSTRAS